MRLWLIIVLGILFGCSAGLGMTWIELRREVVTFEVAHEGTSASPIIGDKIGPKIVVVGGTKFDFGSQPFNSEGEHVFEIINEGDEPLELSSKNVSCGKCILVEFPDTVVLPGKKCEITVGYSLKKEGPHFSESAYFTSNDPRLSMFQLEISGIITKPIRLVPQDLAFGTISATEGSAAKVVLLAYQSPTIEFVGYKLSNEALKDQFEVSAKSLTPEQVKEKDENAVSGLAIDVNAKAGLPIGRINQVISLQVRTDAEHTIDLNSTGEVAGDITIIGKGFNASTSILSIGLVKRGAGSVSNLYLIVKGAHRNDVQMSVSSVDPENWLRVTIGKGEPVAGGKAIKFPLTVEIPKDAPPQDRLGDQRGKIGKIVIQTTHPSAKTIPIDVRFVVE